MKDFGQMMKQAQGLQEKLQAAQARLAETSVEGQAGGGLVRLTLKGSGELVSVSLDDSLLVAGEGEMASDLLVAAHADAKRKLGRRAGARHAGGHGPARRTGRRHGRDAGAAGLQGLSGAPLAAPPSR